MPGLSMPQGGGFWNMAQQHSGLATNQYAAQRPKEETIIEPPGKTVGGGIAAGVGGATAGYALTSSNPYGAAVGAAAMILAYYLS